MQGSCNIDVRRRRIRTGWNDTASSLFGPAMFFPGIVTALLAAAKV
jgi:hypothetical protein